jgi:hypothetical protein
MPPADPIPLSALQHWLYCPRQCALIHNERVWAENRFTAEGQLLHKKANEDPDEHRAAGSILRHRNVSSETLGITGTSPKARFAETGLETLVEPCVESQAIAPPRGGRGLKLRRLCPLDRSEDRPPTRGGRGLKLEHLRSLPLAGGKLLCLVSRNLASPGLSNGAIST